MTGNRDSRGDDALRIVLAYAAVAALWILLSDKAVERLFDDPAKIVLASALKGWLFVATTALLLHGLLRRWRGDGAAMIGAATAKSRLGWPFVLLAIAIVAFAGETVLETMRAHRDKEAARLQAIADLKVRQIADWLGERRGAAEFVRSSAFFAEQYRRRREAGDPAGGTSLQARLDDFRDSHGFDAVALLDPAERNRSGTAGAPDEVAPPLRAAAEAAARDREIHRVGPYLDRAGRPRLDFVAPLVAGPAPLVVLRVDPADWLYPTLQTWPVPSASGETLLFRRDGDRVLYLNELRHQTDAALKLRVPATGNTILAARVARGDALPGRSIEGVDYRGVPALGVAMPVPGTDWFLMAKLDRAELYGEIVGDVAWIALADLLAVLMIGAGTILLRQREQLARAESVRQSQAERLRALNLLGAIADNSEDAIFALDRESRFILFNRAAERITGKTAQEVIGRDETAVFPPELARRLIADNRRVIESGASLVFEEALTAPGGEWISLTTKSPLRDEAGNVVGLCGIGRDITALKRAERALRESEERLRLASASARVGVWDWRLRDGEPHWTAELERLYGYAAGTFPGVYEAFRERVHPDDLAETERLRNEAINANQPFDLDFRVRLPSGATRWINCKGAALYDETGNPQRAFGVNVDITERKQTEEALRWQAEELRQRNEELERFNRAMTGRELDMIALKRRINDLSRELGREPPYPLTFLNAPGPSRPLADGEKT